MTTSRLEAFSDAVLAIIITIMVLELQVPHEPTLHALAESATGLLTYLLSFVYLGIYWNNHHHLFQLVDRVRGGVLWANLHLLFWLSLVPFTTAWMDEQFAPTPVMVYGVNLLLAGLAFLLLQHSIVRVEGPDRPLRQALGRDLKGKISPLIYLVGIIGSLLWVWVGIAAYVLVAASWLVPDRRMEHYIDAHQEPPTLRRDSWADNARISAIIAVVGLCPLELARSTSCLLALWACSPSAPGATCAKRSRGSRVRWEGSRLRKPVHIQFRDSSGWAFHGAGLPRRCLGFVASRRGDLAT